MKACKVFFPMEYAFLVLRAMKRSQKPFKQKQLENDVVRAFVSMGYFMLLFLGLQVKNS